MKPQLRWAACGLLCSILLLSGCAVPRVEVPPSSSMLGSRSNESRIPIKGFKILSEDKTHEITPDARLFVGTSRLILFPKQAREFIAGDLKEYIDSRFKIDPAAEASLTFSLEQAYSYYTYKSSGVNLIPYVGVVTSIIDGFQQAPVNFVVEVEIEARTDSGAKDKLTAFITRSESITGWSGTVDKHREIYLQQILSVRKDLFERLDSQLLSSWRENRFLGSQVRDSNRDSAMLASELARLDAGLADGKISAEEHKSLTTAAKARYVKQ